MKKLFIFSIIVLLFIGCNDLASKKNKKLQRELFFKCLEKIPKGPQRTVTNDWNEVIVECRITAFQLSD